MSGQSVSESATVLPPLTASLTPNHLPLLKFERRRGIVLVAWQPGERCWGEFSDVKKVSAELPQIVWEKKEGKAVAMIVKHPPARVDAAESSVAVRVGGGECHR